jgi:hypothetical protein
MASRMRTWWKRSGLKSTDDLGSMSTNLKALALTADTQLLFVFILQKTPADDMHPKLDEGQRRRCISPTQIQPVLNFHLLEKHRCHSKVLF